MIGAMTGAVESASTNSETALIVLVAERSRADLREQSEPRKWLNIHLPSELQNFRSRTPLPDRIPLLDSRTPQNATHFAIREAEARSRTHHAKHPHPKH